jgi:hypothetical protein
MGQGSRGEQAKMAALVGKAGELATAAQIMVRGLNVFFPAADKGVDVLAENGCRIQVKTGKMRCSPSVSRLYRGGVYSFHFPKSRYMATAKGEVKSTPRRKFSEYCDVVVLWGVEQNRFWVVPAEQLDGVQCIFMGPKNARAFEPDVEAMKKMAELGYSQAEIGKHYGIRQCSVSERLKKAGTPTSPDSVAVSVRACENDWGKILDFSRTTTTVPVEEKVQEE